MHGAECAILKQFVIVTLRYWCILRFSSAHFALIPWDIDQTHHRGNQAMTFHSAPDSFQGLIDRVTDLAAANPVEAFVAFTIILAMTTARFAGRVL